MKNERSATQPDQSTAAPSEEASRPVPSPAPSRSARSPDAPSRHRRKCAVCHHPERSQIDQEFLDWRSVRNIASFYGLADRALYRHAHALGLYARRSRATHSKQTIRPISNRHKDGLLEVARICSRLLA